MSCIDDFRQNSIFKLGFQNCINMKNFLLQDYYCYFYWQNFTSLHKQILEVYIVYIVKVSRVSRLLQTKVILHYIIHLQLIRWTLFIQDYKQFFMVIHSYIDLIKWQKYYPISIIDMVHFSDDDEQQLLLFLIIYCMNKASIRYESGLVDYYFSIQIKKEFIINKNTIIRNF